MKKFIMVSILSLSSSFTLAHSDHAHGPPKAAQCAGECGQAEIEKAVPRALELLTASGKIDTSWAAAKVEKIEKKEFKKGPEWVVTLVDEKKEDAKKQRLYVFLTTKGHLNGSNFTGK